MLDGLIVLRQSVLVAKDVSRMIFEGSFFGGAQNIWGNPYLNSNTILFDTSYANYHIDRSVTYRKGFWAAFCRTGMETLL